MLDFIRKFYFRLNDFEDILISGRILKKRLKNVGIVNYVDALD